MKLSVTTCSGLAGAMSLAIDQISSIPAWAHTDCKVIAAAAVALIGYHAQDRSGKPPAPLSGTVAIIGAILLLTFSGCKVGGLGVQVSSPAFGSVGVTLDGGVIGHGRLSTNLTSAVTAPK
jgi:hypothetical protein